jgi:hypothetical protein
MKLQTIEEMRIEKIQEALDLYDHVSEAAKALECTKRTVFRYIAKGLVKRKHPSPFSPKNHWKDKKINKDLEAAIAHLKKHSTK